jgi:excisionase family DNA binding protein
MLGISQATAYRLMKSGSFRVVKVGGAIRISKKSFDEWLEH